MELGADLRPIKMVRSNAHLWNFSMTKKSDDLIEGLVSISLILMLELSIIHHFKGL